MADLSDDEMDNEARIHQNQPYDESLEVPDAEEIASTYSPTPRVQKAGALERQALGAAGQKKPPPSLTGGGGDSPPMSGGNMTDNSEEDFPTEDDLGSRNWLAEGGLNPNPMGVSRTAAGPQKTQGQYNSEEEEEDGSESSEDDDDDDEHVHVEGAYDPADYENLPVTPEIKELFQYITRYTAQSIELDYKMKPFIPDFIPAVGDIDAFIKIKRPDGKPDTLGLTVLDEPCAKQSDPTVLDLQLRAISKQTTAKTLVVKSLENAEKNPKQIENWIESIRDLHRSKPPPNVHYSKNMPDIETLMQEWPPEFEDLLKEVGLPTAELECDLGQYVEIICSILDIPVYKGSQQQNEKIQALHVLFTLYSEFKNSQHFRALAEENRLDNSIKKGEGGLGSGGDDHLLL